jgi:hypothetical protein
MNKLPNSVSSYCSASTYLKISFSSDHPMFDEREFKELCEHLALIIINGKSRGNRSDAQIRFDVMIGLKPEYHAYKVLGHDFPGKNVFDYDTILKYPDGKRSLYVEHKTQVLSSDYRESWFINSNSDGKLTCNHLLDVIKSKKYSDDLRIWKWNYCTKTQRFYLMFIIVNTDQLPFHLSKAKNNKTFVQTILMAKKGYLIFNPTINDLYR